MKFITITATMLAAVLLTGCGGGKVADQSAQAQATTQATSQAPGAPTTPVRDLGLGATATLADTGSTAVATAYAYRQPLRSMFPPDRHGYTYAGVDARVCIQRLTDGDRVPVSWAPWSLEFADDTVTEPVSSWSDEWFRVPLYPAVERLVRVGKCVRGWILFEVPKGKRPVRIVYAPESGTEEATPTAVWTVGS